MRRGSVPPHLTLWLRGHSWIQQALCEPLPRDSPSSELALLLYSGRVSAVNHVWAAPWFMESGVFWDTPTVCPSAPQPCLHSLGKASGSACPPSSLKGLSGQWWLLGRSLLQSPWPLVGCSKAEGRGCFIPWLFLWLPALW